MKTLTPKLGGDDLRELIQEMGATPAQVARWLGVSERSLFRWLADGTAPRAVLYACWHETPQGRYAVALDVGYEAQLSYGLAEAHAADAARSAAALQRLAAISDTGAANDALPSLPASFTARRYAMPVVLDAVFWPTVAPGLRAWR